MKQQLIRQVETLVSRSVSVRNRFIKILTNNLQNVLNRTKIQIYSILEIYQGRLLKIFFIRTFN